MLKFGLLFRESVDPGGTMHTHCIVVDYSFFSIIFLFKRLTKAVEKNVFAQLYRIQAYSELYMYMYTKNAWLI